jgi:hypothetical protein
MLLLALLVLAVAAPAQAGAPWRWPLRGEVVTPFRITANPFAPGQHRGIDIAAAAGARVRSACPGRVRFAGRVPGRRRAVTVDCGGLLATYLELASTAVRRGQPIAAGALVGAVAASHLQLGARRAGRRMAYVDPLTLLARDPPPPLGAAPRRTPEPPVRPRARPARPTPAPARPLLSVPEAKRARSAAAAPGRAAAGAPERAGAGAPEGAGAGAPEGAAAGAPERAGVGAPERAGAALPRRVPLTAWLGLALLTAGTPVGALWRRRRRASRRLAMQAVDDAA